MNFSSLDPANPKPGKLGTQLLDRPTFLSCIRLKCCSLAPPGLWAMIIENQVVKKVVRAPASARGRAWRGAHWASAGYMESLLVLY
jgi:hypothetical protein